MFLKTAFCVLCFFALLLMPVWAYCPSADLNGDCRVDLADFAFMANQWLTDGLVPEDMVRIPGGTFQMGDSFNEGLGAERPVHRVTLSSFYISKYETTNIRYCEFLNAALAEGLITVINGIVYKADPTHPYCSTSTSSPYSQISFLSDTFTVHTKGGRDMSNDPMVSVTWYGAAAYCNWLSAREGFEPFYDLSTWESDFSKNGYRLPTEAQWEYAARGGLTSKRFPWGDKITHSQANYWSNSFYGYDTSSTRGYHPTWNDGIEPYTSPVGSFPPTGYGLYDMTGNVREWCNDWSADSYYSSSQQLNPTGPITEKHFRILRGGAWGRGGTADVCRVAYRLDRWPGYEDHSFGFRVCR